MKRAVKAILALCAGMVLMTRGVNIKHYAEEEQPQGIVRILFTNDLNDHILSTGAVITRTGEEGNRTQKTEASGGYACLKKVIAVVPFSIHKKDGLPPLL